MLIVEFLFIYFTKFWVTLSSNIANYIIYWTFFVKFKLNSLNSMDCSGLNKQMST